MVQDVKDKVAERGINLSVVIQTLLLASTIGFGTKLVNSVDRLTAVVGELTTSTTLNAAEINHNRADINRLRLDIEKHIHEFPHYASKP